MVQVREREGDNSRIPIRIRPILID